ncbi:E3 ubiquitin-protein ligase arih1l-like [Phymastichus coffea]|uniref:E3 ubiquitin-protein ligase arih1l-like n=1 Tax=Phymastichus coffea TaxID=108790 RepID=UPI00273C964E|nr:E3 ubiquitin-protein ligase arih1l-like [Phymastichus coffea]XP_058795262.1 E3 ubiquitin-protein ligase arih1l-like [Phymastichus coffea]XP_058795263.1 E3 ubiquitin-protein ligase arih1l-like [Phymastichus coffea]XP_058795265.1 E3 ubiquitin-protein ligase arih1l-like [Phymastichus coffea]XP_058795266.1 E3 ubiquitin-protein ligase arih1l-like [Phymastichus coffea]XP_058795267.1 E3 ubiquitin-protein ligase arih1l-like [Phymastichus coffea]XP_058795268.1 E3 ubiquitin-protein ligase arih1l-lik
MDKRNSLIESDDEDLLNEDDGEASELYEIDSDDDEDEKYQFKVLTIEEIVEEIADCIKEVNVIVQMPPTVTRNLLIYFNWDKQTLMEKYYGGNPEKLFEEAKIANPHQQTADTSAISSSIDAGEGSSNAQGHCEICCTSVPPSELTGFQCRHRYCRDCWNKYLTEKVLQEDFVYMITCAAHNCDILIDYASVMELANDNTVRLRYQYLIANSYVKHNALLKWCPGVACNYAIKVQCIDTKQIKCKCGMAFCFSCGGDYHEPLSCELLRKWLAKCKADTEPRPVDDAKDCPKCQKSVEKTGGCNRVRCKKCHYQFCWVCTNDWFAHPFAWNKCNKYVKVTPTLVESASQETTEETAAQRYLCYRNRYLGHLQSFQLEQRLRADMQKKMEEMQQSMTWIEVQFLKVAIDVLHECRRTLMYTYAFAYYVKKSNQTELFEVNQRDLEYATETLSGYLEQDIVLRNILDTRQKVQDKYEYCKHRRMVLLEHVQEGYDNDTWEFYDSDV